MSPRRLRFEDFSEEIIALIIRELPPWSQSSLSLVSKFFRKHTLPFLISSLKIRTRRDALKFIHYLGKNPSWASLVKSLRIEIPFWEVSVQPPRHRQDFDPEIFAQCLMSNTDYIGALINLERLVFEETASDNLGTIEYILRAQRLTHLKEFTYVSPGKSLPSYHSVDDFIFRHQSITSLELPASLLLSPDNMEFPHLVKFTGSPRFFLKLIATPKLSAVKFVIPSAGHSPNMLRESIRSLSWSCEHLRRLECVFLDWCDIQVVDYASQNFPDLEYLKIKWDKDSSFDSDACVEGVGSYLRPFECLKYFDYEARLHVYGSAPTAEVPKILARYCPSLITCGWLSECWARKDPTQAWTQRHRWK